NRKIAHFAHRMNRWLPISTHGSSRVCTRGVSARGTRGPHPRTSRAISARPSPSVRLERGTRATWVQRGGEVCVLALTLALISTPAFAQVNVLPTELENVGVDEHLGAEIPLDAVFRDEHGRQVQLRQYFDGRRPVVLDLYYDRCPM